MKQFIAFTVFTVFSFQFLVAQQTFTTPTLIYKVSIDEITKLIKYEEAEEYDKSYNLLKTLYYNLVDSSDQDIKVEKPYFENGYYIKATADKEILHLKFISIQPLIAKIIHDNKFYILQVFDSLYHPITDAQVTLKDKKFTYDAATQSYRLKKGKKEGIITISTDEYAIFYDVELEKYYDDYYENPETFWEHLGYPFVRFGVTWWHRHYKVQRTYEKIANQIESRRDEERWLNSPKWKKRKGYIAVNKPKYRHNDTLKVKAYITTKKGKPRTGPMEFAIYDRNIYGEEYIDEIKPIFSTIVQPNAKGNYTYDFVLGDSLTLDKNYYAFFLKKKNNKKKKRIYFGQKFRLEDYELENIEYQLNTPLSIQYEPEQKLIVTASAKDQNNNFIPDGMVDLTLITDDIQDFYQDEIIVKDTVWQTTTPLKNNSPTQIIIPWEKLPTIKGKFLLKSRFYNSNGEGETKSNAITINNTQEFIKIKFDSIYIIAEYWRNNESIKTTGQLTQFFKTNSRGAMERDIQFPFKEKLNPYALKYIFSANGISRTKSTKGSQGIVWSGGHAHDSIFITLNNPKQIPISYEIYKLNKLVDKGFTAETSWYYSDANASHKTYTVKYFYPKNGDIGMYYEYYPFYEDELSIRINQPKLVIPGQNIPVSITVVDTKNKPAKSVDLTAFAVNAALKGDKHYIKPWNKSVKSLNYGKFRGSVDFEHFFDYSSTRQDLDSAWLTKMSLENHLYYRVRFPEHGFLTEYTSYESDTFLNQFAQFSPYVVKYGEMQAIHLIYCNDEIVYYRGAKNNRNYAFIAKEGYQTITVRTDDALYQIDSVLLKKGQKLELSLDEKRYKASSHHRFITKTPMPEKLTSKEYNMIKSNFMIINRDRYDNTQYLWQDENDIHVVKSGYGEVIVGPFRDNDTIHYEKVGGLSKNFKFEAGFKYEIETGLVRLYKDEAFLSQSEKELNDGRRYSSYYDYDRQEDLHPVGESMYRPSSIQKQTPYYFDVDLSLFYQYTDYEYEFDAKYEFDIADNDKIKSVVWINKGHVAWVMPYKTSYKLPEADYQVYFFRFDSTYFTVDISLKNYQTYCYRLNEIPQLQVDSNHTLLKKYFYELKKVFDYSYTSQYSSRSSNYAPRFFLNKNDLKGQIIDNETGKPIIGAKIKINGTSIEAITDTSGNYSLTIPYGNDVLNFSHTGYASKQIRITEEISTIDVSMNAGVGLEELVITAAGVEKSEQAINYAVVYALRGQAAGVNVIRSSGVSGAVSKIAIRGNTSSNISKPLYVVDGVVATDLSEIDSDDIASTQVLKDATATALYGARASSGVVIITTKKAELFNQALQTTQMRNNFKDYAYWQPNLITDKNGEAHFNVKFPDNITQWNTTVLGMDRKARSGTTTTRTKSYKPVMGQLAIPRFLVTGDNAKIIGKSINYTSDSFEITTTFKQGATILKTNESLLTQSLIENTTITAPQPTDSLTLSYQLTTTEFSDGEERTIPVFPLGIKESNGFFYAFDKDTTIEFTFENTQRDIQLVAQSDILDLLLEDIKYLKDYPYGCNEQTASRLMALIMEEKIKKQLGEKCNNSRAIKKMLNRLEKTQNENGSFGWWANGEPNIWMTAYVTKALLFAAENDHYRLYASTLHEAEFFLKEETPYNRLTQTDKLSLMSIEVDLGDNYGHKTQLLTIDTTRLSLHQRMQFVKIQQNAGINANLDTLIKLMDKTTFGGYFWGEQGYFWSSNRMELTLMAYEIFKKAGREDICKGIRQYFLEKRQHNGWRNTFETAQILYTILPDVLNGKEKLEKSQLIINGGTPITLNQPVFKANFSNTKSITIKKKGDTPVFITAFQTFQNNNPKPKKDIFEIKTEFIQGKKTSTNRNIRLEKNQPLTLQATVEVKEAAEYVMIEIPIPAGCSYESKRGEYGYEVHREHFKDKVAIFFEDLPIGTHTFNIQLEARYAGDFTLNPAKVEQMYFPIFYGRNGMKKVEISSEN